MAVIDPRKTWRLSVERLAVEQDPIRRRNLAALVTHMMAEAHLDMDALMATVSPDAHYHFWADAGATELIGRDAVAEFYRGIAGSGMHRLHHDINRLVVDAECIVTEGEMCIAYPGDLLNKTRELNLDADRHYLYQAQMLIVWPIDAEGLFVGEDSYSGGDGFADIASRPIDPSDIIHIEDLGPPNYPQP